MTLDEVIKQKLAEANLLEQKTVAATVPPVVEVKEVQVEEVQVEAKVELKAAEADEVGTADEVDTAPKKKSLTKESVSGQVNLLLDAEGLSEDFKLQAVTIFEAAIADQVMVLEEKLKTDFDSQLAEAKAELDNDIDGFLSEAVQQWQQDNEVAIQANFKSQVAESFMDGMKALIAEHNIELPEDKEDALEVAIAEVDKLNESIATHASQMLALQEQVNEMKAEKILESFKEKMTHTEFDRFTQLTESVKFSDEAQYTKQLTIVLENFGSNKTAKVEAAPIIESTTVAATKLVTENTDVNQYASFISKQLR